MLASGSGRKARHAIGVMFRRFVKIYRFSGPGAMGRGLERGFEGCLRRPNASEP